MYVCMYVCMYVYMRMCEQKCIVYIPTTYMHIYIHTHTYTHMISGVLCDEMGLGKTVELLQLVLMRPPQDTRAIPKKGASCQSSRKKSTATAAQHSSIDVQQVTDDIYGVKDEEIDQISHGELVKDHLVTCSHSGDAHIDMTSTKNAEEAATAMQRHGNGNSDGVDFDKGSLSVSEEVLGADVLAGGVRRGSLLEVRWQGEWWNARVRAVRIGGKDARVGEALVRFIGDDDGDDDM